jgi:hypothetical protein
MKDVRYIIHKNSNMQPCNLYRFSVEDENFSPCFLDEDGSWVEDWSLFNLLNDMHNPAFDEITEDEALRIAKEIFGVEFEPISKELIAA